MGFTYGSCFYHRISCFSVFHNTVSEVLCNNCILDHNSHQLEFRRFRCPFRSKAACNWFIVSRPSKIPGTREKKHKKCNNKKTCGVQFTILMFFIHICDEKKHQKWEKNLPAARCFHFWYFSRNPKILAKQGINCMRPNGETTLTSLNLTVIWYTKIPHKVDILCASTRSVSCHPGLSLYAQE